MSFFAELDRTPRPPPVKSDVRVPYKWPSPRKALAGVRRTLDSLEAELALVEASLNKEPGIILISNVKDLERLTLRLLSAVYNLQGSVETAGDSG